MKKRKKPPFSVIDHSVRTTFTLPENTVDSIKTIALEHGIKMKTLFESMTDFVSQLPPERFSIIQKQKKTFRSIKKTFVLTKHSLESLKYYSKKYKIPRDQLVELIVDIYPTMRATEEEIIKQNHKKALAIIKNFILGAENTINDLYKILEDDDPIPDIFELILDLSGALENLVESEIKKGTPIDIPVDIAIAINDLSKKDE